MELITQKGSNIFEDSFNTDRFGKGNVREYSTMFERCYERKNVRDATEDLGALVFRYIRIGVSGCFRMGEGFARICGRMVFFVYSNLVSVLSIAATRLLEFKDHLRKF